MPTPLTHFLLGPVFTAAAVSIPFLVPFVAGYFGRHMSKRLGLLQTASDLRRAAVTPTLIQASMSALTGPQRVAVIEALSEFAPPRERLTLLALSRGCQVRQPCIES